MMDSSSAAPEVADPGVSGMARVDLSSAHESREWTALRCSLCDGPVIVDGTGWSGQCAACLHESSDLKNQINWVKRAKRMMEKGSKSLDSGRRLDAEEALLEAHRVMKGLLYQKNHLLVDVKGELGRCYGKMRLWSQAIDFSKQRMVHLKAMFGETSREVASASKTVADLEWEQVDEKERMDEVLDAARRCLVSTAAAAKLLKPFAATDAMKEEIKELEQRLVYCLMLEQGTAEFVAKSMSNLVPEPVAASGPVLAIREK